MADDVETVPLALSLNPTGGVLADLHEYSPRLKENLPRWRFFVGPYMRWLCRSAVTRAKRVSTVCEGLANEYHREFGFLPSVVTNAAPFRDASPTPVSNPIRLVHSGAAMPDRELEVMVDAVAKLNTRTPGRFLFDLYLTPNNPNYVAKLRERVADSPFIQILDPVSASELREKLATYDVGLFACPDTTFSLRHALPNKFFDYVQARLGIVISPSPEMSRLLNRHKLGVVSTTFEAESFANALDTLTPEKVAEYKLASHSAAQELSGENQVPVFLSLVEQILRREN
ncbi:glycosyltransferase family 1 protein [Dermabacteraceae bacterium P7006]